MLLFLFALPMRAGYSQFALAEPPFGQDYCANRETAGNAISKGQFRLSISLLAHFFLPAKFCKDCEFNCPIIFRNCCLTLSIIGVTLLYCKGAGFAQRTISNILAL